MQQKQSFICKLHGSISSIENTVFTTEDYLELERDASYLSLMEHIFADAVVVFIGYGLKDEYVLTALTKLEPQVSSIWQRTAFLGDRIDSFDLAVERNSHQILRRYARRSPLGEPGAGHYPSS